MMLQLSSAEKRRVGVTSAATPHLDVHPNRTKVYGRCGMGLCPGRTCGLAVTEILAAENGLTQDAVGRFRIKAPLKPVTLSELAALAED